MKHFYVTYKSDDKFVFVQSCTLLNRHGFFLYYSHKLFKIVGFFFKYIFAFMLVNCFLGKMGFNKFSAGQNTHYFQVCSTHIFEFNQCLKEYCHLI